MYIPHVGAVVGRTSENRWGQVLQTPGLYGVIEVEDASGNAIVTGSNIVSTLFGLGGTISESSVHQVIQSVGRDRLSTLLLILPHEDSIRVLLYGKGCVYIYRDHQLACLLDAPGSISGSIKKGDVLVCISGSFIPLLPQKDLIDCLKSTTAQEISEQLTLFFHTQQSASGGAILVYQAGEDSMRASALVINKQRRFSLERMKNIVKHRHISSNVNKTAFTVTILFLVAFCISVVLGISKQMSIGKNISLSLAVQEASHGLEEGIALSQLNPVKSRERLKLAKAKLLPFIETISTRTKEERDARALYKQIDENLTQAMQSISGEPMIFYEVDLLKKGAIIEAIALEGDTMGIVDSRLSTIFELTVSTKNGQIMGGGDGVSGLRLVSLRGSMLYVLSADGVDSIDRMQKKLVKAVVKSDDSWGTIGALVSFGGNIYMLDTQKSRIWKYVATETGFSQLREYLNPDTLPDLSHGVSMAIDGSVWVGTSDGNILKFTQGHEETFVPQGVDPAFGKTLFVYTSDESKNLYVLDLNNKRVVVLDKEGMYLAQYVWQGSFRTTQFVVSESQKKIILLAEGKLYTIDLK